MKFLVFSDSHRQMRNLRRVLSMQTAPFDAILHLGDGADEVLSLRREFPDIPIHAVRGNCDGFDLEDYDIPAEKLLRAEGKTLFLCHGDRHFVAYGTEGLAAYAKRRGADIALYGHLHTAHEEYLPPDPDDPLDRPFWIFSPGSISLPRDGTPSFGILDVSSAGVLFSVGRLRG